jgi:hypothetical protein
VRVWETSTGKLLFFTDLTPYLLPGTPVMPVFVHDNAVLHPSGNQVLAQPPYIPKAHPGMLFDLPYKNFAEVVAAAYAAVPYRFTDDERTELELDLFGKVNPEAASLEPLTVKQYE